MPGYVDLQINGYAGVDFNSEHIQADELHHCCQTLERDGVDGILATLITDDVDVMCRRIAKIVLLREQDELAKRLIWGLHIEGPFISSVPGFVGAHPIQHAQPACVDAMSRLLDAGAGLVRIVTLAPEMDPRQQVTKMLSDKGIVVSAGHTDASRAQLEAAIDAGLSMFTHLGNGCPMLMNRHDNIIQRALSFSDRIWSSFIVDGAHIPFFALRNYLKLVGLERAVVVTDAISAAGCGPGRFKIGDRAVTVGEDGVPRADDHSHLVGSGTIMSKMDKNLRQDLGMSAEQVDQLTKTNPKKILAAFPGLVPSV